MILGQKEYSDLLVKSVSTKNRTFKKIADTA